MEQIRYFINGEPHYLVNGQSMTESELQGLTDEIAQSDEDIGYRDRMAGFYDKWYRYHHSDNGAAYDKGVKRAQTQPHCPAHCHVIECKGA